MIVSSVIANNKASNFWIYGHNTGRPYQGVGHVLRTDDHPSNYSNKSWYKDPIQAMANLERNIQGPDDIWFSTLWDEDEGIYEVHVANHDKQDVLQLYPTLTSTFRVDIVVNNAHSMAKTRVCEASFHTSIRCLEFAEWFKVRGCSIRIGPTAIAESPTKSYVYDQQFEHHSFPERWELDKDFVVIRNDFTMNRIHWHNDFISPFRAWHY